MVSAHGVSVLSGSCPCHLPRASEQGGGGGSPRTLQTPAGTPHIFPGVRVGRKGHACPQYFSLKTTDSYSMGALGAGRGVWSPSPRRPKPATPAGYKPHSFLRPPRAEFRRLLCTRQHMDSSIQPQIRLVLQERLGGCGGGEADMEGFLPGCGT